MISLNVEFGQEALKNWSSFQDINDYHLELEADHAEKELREFIDLLHKNNIELCPRCGKYSRIIKRETIYRNQQLITQDCCNIPYFA